MAKKIIVGDLAVTGNNQILGDCVVSGETSLNGPVETGGDLTVTGDITCSQVRPGFIAVDGAALQAGGGILTSITSNFAHITSSEIKLSSSGNVIINIDSDGNNSTKSLIVAKNSTSSSPIAINKLLQLTQVGGLYVRGPFSSNYNFPFTGAHVYPSAEDLSSHVGSALVLVAGERVELSSADSSKNVVGLLISCQAKGDTETSSLGPVPENMGYICHVAAVGDSRTSQLQGASVCNEGGDIEVGDLLVTSSIPGYLKKQQDDIIRSSTVAKAMQPVSFNQDGVATGVYCYVYCG